jgi:hypothetical protein
MSRALSVLADQRNEPLLLFQQVNRASERIQAARKERH